MSVTQYLTNPLYKKVQRQLSALGLKTEDLKVSENLIEFTTKHFTMDQVNGLATLYDTKVINFGTDGKSFAVGKSLISIMEPKI